MNEENIRPAVLMREEKRLREKDAERLLRQANTFVEIACPACESKDCRKAFIKDGFNFVVCRECGTLYVNPRPNFEMLKDYYTAAKSIKYWNDEIFPASEDSRRNLIFIPRAKRVIELCKKHRIQGGILADVGAGFGTFCEEVKKMGFFDKIIPIEPSPDLAKSCRGKGLKVIEKPIEEVEIPSIDVITNFELIEHLFWPRHFLLACSKALRKGGLLILTTPNVQGFDLFVLGKSAQNISAPDHLNYFHPASLGLLLERCGFKTTEVITPGRLDVEIVRKKILSGEFDVSANPFLKCVLVEHYNEAIGRTFQRFLSDNKLSSHLWVVAEKVAQ